MIPRELKHVAQVYWLINNIPYDCCVWLNVVANYIRIKLFGMENIKLNCYDINTRYGVCESNSCNFYLRQKYLFMDVLISEEI